MKLYFSGLGGAQKFIIDVVLALPVHRALVSFYYPQQLDKLLKQSKDWSFFVDSGAYSAYNSGVTIDIDDYIAFIKEISSFVEISASLDVLGDPEQSMKNYLYMMDAGVDVWPTYHFGEPTSFLDSYVEITNSICVGGVAGTGITPKSIQENLKLIYSRYPYLKIHVFGVNSFSSMLGLPIYSVDALTWRSGSRFGDAFISGRRYKVGRIAPRTPVFWEAAKYLKEKAGFDVTVEDMNWNHLDIYNIGELYRMLEVEHDEIVRASTVSSQYLF